MAATLDGLFTQDLGRAENLIAASSSFQTWTSSVDADAAKAFIDLIDVAAGYTRPHCLLYNAEGFSMVRVAGGSASTFRLQTSVIGARFEADASGDDASDEALVFIVEIEDIIADITANLAGKGGELNVTNIVLLDELERITADHTGERDAETAGANEDYFSITLGLIKAI